MGIVEIPFTDTTDAMSVKTSTAVNVHVFSISAYYKTDSFVRSEQIEDLRIPQRDASSSHVSFLHVLFRMYDF